MHPFERFARALSMTENLHGARMAKTLSKHDLTVQQFWVLNHIARQGREGQSIASIARAVEVNQPAVTKMVQKFERLGWVESRGNGRGRSIALTQTGGQMIGQVVATLAPDTAASLAGFSDAEIAQLTDGLERLAAWYDANRID